MKTVFVTTAITSATIETFGKAHKLAIATGAKIVAMQDKAVQIVLDAMVINADKPKAEFLKGNARSNPARAQIAELFAALVEKDYIKAKSAAQYQSCFWLAFENGVPFSRSLINEKAATKKAEGASKATATPKAGKVESTTRAELDKTLSKAIKQARLLGLTEFAACVLDQCIESLDAFKEIE
jgi:hypothetical protein